MQRKQEQVDDNIKETTDLISLDNSNINTNNFAFDSSIKISPVKTYNPLNKTENNVKKSLSFTLCDENNDQNNIVENKNLKIKDENTVYDNILNENNTRLDNAFDIDYTQLPKRKRVKITDNSNILEQEEKFCNISFFNDQSMNDIVRSYLKNPSEQNISILDCVDVKEDKNVKDESIFYFIVDKKNISTIKEIYDILGMNFESLDINQKGIEAVFENIKLKLKISTKTTAKVEKEELNNEENKIDSNYTTKNLDKLNDRILVLENMLKYKDEVHEDDQVKIAEYRRIETSLRHEIDELYKKLNFEQCLLKHAEDKAKNLEYKSKLDNNTFIVDNIERLGNINKENANNYMAEINTKNEELVQLRKQNRIFSNKLSDMEIVVEELTKKLNDKKEREIDEEINNENSQF